MEKDEVQKSITDNLTNIKFKKTGDTPLEAFDLANKNYVDNYGCMRIYLGTNQTLTSGVDATVAFDTLDNGSPDMTFNSANNSIKVGHAGRYLVMAQVDCRNLTDADQIQLWLSVNGGKRTAVIVWQSVTVSTNSQSVQSSDVFNLNAQDYITVVVNFISSGSPLTALAGQWFTFLNVVKA